MSGIEQLVTQFSTPQNASKLPPETILNLLAEAILEEVKKLNNSSSSSAIAPITFVIGNSIDSDFTLNHNLNSLDVSVEVRQTNSPYQNVLLGIQKIDENNVIVSVNPIPSTNEFTIVIRK